MQASWTRASELESLKYSADGLQLVITEETTGRHWVVDFRSVQAFRVTTEELSSSVLDTLPTPGGFFEVEDSTWIRELGLGEVSFIEGARHYIVSCYEEVIEVVARDCSWYDLSADGEAG